MARNKHEAAQAVVSEIQRRLGEQAIRKAPKPTLVSTVPTGYTILDSFLSGVPQNHITEFVGVPTCGMTTLAYKIGANAQASGEPFFYVDLRYSFDPYYAAGCGVNTEKNKLILIRHAFVVSALDAACHFVSQKSGGVIAINSTTEILKTAGGSQMLDATLRKLSSLLHGSGCAVVFLSPLPKKSAALANSATLQLGFERKSWVESRHKLLGYETNITVLRNRLGRVGQAATIYVSLDSNLSAQEREKIA